MEATSPECPAITPIFVENIPSSLKAVQRWLCWRWTLRGKKWDKPPMRAGKNAGMASSTDPATWTTFEEAVASVEKKWHHGIGFVLGEDKTTGLHYAGLDLDDCIVKGKVNPSALYFLGMLPSYSEISPSGEGIKVFCLGMLPEGSRTEKDLGMELYDSGRYFTVTGNRFDGRFPEVCDCTKQLVQLHASVFYRYEAAAPRMTEREIALTALEHLDRSRADDYHSWLNVGMALQSVADDLIGAWEAWSRHSSKFVEGECAKKWKNFKKSGIRIGSLIMWARKDGWIWPPKGRTQTPLPIAPSRNIHETNGHAPTNGEVDLDSPHMGDGLTEHPGAGPWRLQIVNSDPVRYRLKSPIWENSPRLAKENGYVTLTTDQIYSWALIRKIAGSQAALYVPHDSREQPVWDGRAGPQLLRRLLASAEQVGDLAEFNATLSAAEFIVEAAYKFKPIPEEAHDSIKGKPVCRFEDGTIIFRIRELSALAVRSAPGISFEHIRSAAKAYATEYHPRSSDKKSLGRFHRFTSDQVQQIQRLIDPNHDADDG